MLICVTAREDRSEPAFTLSGGGLAHDVMQRLGLAHGDAHDVRRQSAALVAMGWLGMMTLAVLESLFGGSTALVRDVSVHVRLLVAIPLFVMATAVMTDRCRDPLDQLAHGQPEPVRAGVARILERATRVRDAWLPELVFVVAALAISVSLWSMSGSAGLVGRHAGAPDVSATHGWYALVGLPLFMFFLARTLWLWILWGWICWQVSRLPLSVIATHPDRAGGLEYIARPIAGFAVVAAADSAVVASAWAEPLVDEGATFSTYGPSLAMLVLLHLVIALTPSCFFFGHLLRGRLAGLRAYDRLARRYVDAFHERWVVNAGGHHELLGASDIQSLADLGGSYEVVEQMRVVPFGRRLVSMVVLATLVPMLPLAFTQMSAQEVVAMLGRSLAGGRLG